MTLEMAVGTRGVRAPWRRGGAGDAPDLTVIPEAPEQVLWPWERIGVDRYRVTDGAATRGFVDVVGPVFVGLAGERYDRAVEIAQTLSLESAAEAILRASGAAKA
ncbi:hypothetical protein RYJ27_10085 [Microbacterium limosum]|uniref:Uncharacterized protein n=1 Tax=Microbacterium limosum TaxID=3079935 RepID=A0AAU0MER5_9MICO|nr:hypothetical protein [Microbacterium sp. Y20]WOQ69048.1 hypothetical protein RYJ27_10085 [Microbacterium sp. Y20]